jgi:hypothetical protein
MCLTPTNAGVRPHQPQLRLFPHRARQLSRDGQLDAVVHRIDFERDLGFRIFARPGEPDHEVDVGLEKTQAVSGLHEVCVGRSAPFVHTNQRVDAVGEILLRAVCAKPLADDFRAPIRMGFLVRTIVQLDGDGVWPPERALHIMRERCQTDGIRRIGREAIEPVERFEKMRAVVADSSPLPRVVRAG